MKELSAQEVFDYLKNLNEKGQDLSKYKFVVDLCINQIPTDFFGMYMDYDTTEGVIYIVCNEQENVSD